ncbi:MAG: hypothetical protein LBR80_05560 [Deltaproteobacteria bacterium]|jgi:tetratricopeptide (TPR) repeat protein|nr:hypothetical protein [Deltaproteobacteria bacterium]
MSISTSEGELSLPVARLPLPYAPSGRVSRFESEAVARLCEECGCATVTELPGGDRPPLDLRETASARLVHCFPEEDPNGPGGDSGPRRCCVAVTRRFGVADAPAPDPDEVKDELELLFSLAARYAVALYPAASTPRLGEIAAELHRPFGLEGFIPHRFPETFHDRGETSLADLYVFTQPGEPLPAAFRAPGGRHAFRIPLRQPDGRPEDPELLLQAVKELAARRETGKAVPLLSRLARMRPEDSRLRLNLGYFLLNVESHASAAAAFRSVLADDPENGEARRALAGIHLHARDWAELRAFLPELMLLKASNPKLSGIWPEIRQGFLELERST